MELALWNSDPGNIHPPFVWAYSTTIPDPGFRGTMAFNYTTPSFRYNANDQVEFFFNATATSVATGLPVSNYTASVAYGPAASLISTTQGGGSTYAEVAQVPNPYIVNQTNFNNNTSTLTFSPELTAYVDYQFVPYFESGSATYSSSLYTTYGDINVAFSPQSGDLLVLADDTGTTQDLEVISTQSITTGNGIELELTLTPNILANWQQDFTLVTKVLILRKYKDEQNVMLQFNKLPGQTSYGFIIPDQTNPQVLAQINTLQSAVQSQTLTTQAGSGQ
jgi:hypothetical protein